MKKLLTNKNILIIAAICVLTFVCYRYTLQNEFTNWDDDYYVTNDPYIKALTPHNLKVIFTEDITRNNYHPFCMLSLAINYYFAQMNPWSYYLTNILIHTANVVLIFLLFMQICAMLRMDDKAKTFIAAFGALLFGVHPMHVESVSWIAERKDVLYAFFYILGLLSYLRYVAEGKAKWYWITFLLFIASCLSKPMAVVFPLSLFCFDILFQRKWNKKLVLEKGIFFLVSLICGGFAYYTQNKVGAIASFNKLSLFERTVYASYGYMMYVGKFFVPEHLSSFYPYPYHMLGGGLPKIYYFAPFISIAIIAVPLLLTYKRNKAYFRVLLFGLGFLTVNLIFVLQFISCGAAIMADRYSYVSYIGLLFVVIYFIYELVRRWDGVRMPMTIGLVLVGLILSYKCYERTLVWHDSETLHTDAIEKYPYQAWLSYKWLGNYYFDKQEYDKAMENYKVLAMLHMADPKVESKINYINIMKNGGNTGAFAAPVNPDAIAAEGNAPQSDGAPVNANQPNAPMPVFNNNSAPGDPKECKKYIDSTIYYCNKGDDNRGFRSYISALRINRSAEQMIADSSFKLLHSGAFALSEHLYNVLLKINTGNGFFYFYRGVAEYSGNKTKEAMDDWLIAVKMNPKDVQQSASYNLGVAYATIGKDSLAVHYLEMAKGLGYNVSDDYLNKVKVKMKTFGH